MQTFQDILFYIVDTLGTLFLVFVLLRFFLQLARADFYNPFSQAIVKITNPVLIPLRRLIPGAFGVDIASIFLALAVQMIVGELIYFIYSGGFFNPLSLFIWAILGTLNLVTYIGFAAGIILVISSFIAPFSQHPIITLAKQLMEPLIEPVRKIIPAVGGLDFSVMFVFMGIVIAQKILSATAMNAGLLPKLVIGY